MTSVVAVDNAAFDMNRITPNKRKRDSAGGGRVATARDLHNKENPIYAHNGYMEVKSLADLMPTNPGCSNNNNAFEVQRKPPKKKTKLDQAESQCFVNAALNLNGPESVPVNPFEIRRASVRVAEPHNNCFVNTALNIRGPEKEVRNPFEIVRPHGNSTAGDQNVRLSSPHISRAIAIPFTPTIGCRINFNDVPLESLTPCSMLAKKLVFSPAPQQMQNRGIVNDMTPTKADGELSVISEESLDIIAELDCYQLELENSINEAKIKKRGRRSGSAGRGKNLMDLKNRKSFATLLSQAEQRADADDELDQNKSVTGADEDLSTKLTPKLLTADPLPCEKGAPSSDHSGVDYEEIDEASDAADSNDPIDDEEEEEFAFKNPAPFVRTFKRKSVRRPATTATVPTTEADSAEPSEKPSNGIRQSIRNSIRRLIKSQPKKSASAEHVNADIEAMPAPTTMFASLRQSLRRKKQPELPECFDHEVSILCDTERAVFRQQPSTFAAAAAAGSKRGPSAQTQSNEDLGQKKVASSLRSSIRNTTKDVRRQVMKSMFKKNVEEYQF